MKIYKCPKGYYITKVQVDKELKYMPYASAGVVFYNDDNTTNLISYTTRVITIDKNGWLTCTGTYSATTRKHIGAFLREYACTVSYYDAKYCYENDLAMNIHTGEIITLDEYYNK